MHAFVGGLCYSVHAVWMKEKWLCASSYEGLTEGEGKGIVAEDVDDVLGGAGPGLLEVEQGRGHQRRERDRGRQFHGHQVGDDIQQQLAHVCTNTCTDGTIMQWQHPKLNV